MPVPAPIPSPFTCKQVFSAVLLSASVIMLLACGGGGSRPVSSQRGSDFQIGDNPGAVGADPAEAKINAIVEERLKQNAERHAKAVTRYEADLAKYNVDLPAYEADLARYGPAYRDYEKAKREFDAAGRLQTMRKLAKQYTEAAVQAKAQGGLDQAERLMDSARGRYDEVIKGFPGTQAAVEAQALRKGEDIPQKPLPPEPAPPRKPVPPTKPTPPVPPPSPESLRAAVKKEHDDAVAKAETDKHKKEDETQADRKEFIAEMQRAGVVQKLDGGENPHLWVTPKFLALSFDDKKKIVEIAFAYTWRYPRGTKKEDVAPTHFLHLYHSITGKRIGIYSPSTGLDL